MATQRGTCLPQLPSYLHNCAHSRKMAASSSGGRRNAMERSKDEVESSAIPLLQFMACSFPRCLLEMLRLWFEASATLNKSEDEVWPIRAKNSFTHQLTTSVWPQSETLHSCTAITAPVVLQPCSLRGRTRPGEYCDPGR